VSSGDPSYRLLAAAPAALGLGPSWTERVASRRMGDGFMNDLYVVVDGLVHRGHGQELNIREDWWSVALDQRVFGPRRLLVAFAERDGNVISLAHTERLDPPEDGLDPCIRHLGLGAVAAVAFCDEPVPSAPPPDDLAERFAHARAVAADWGVHLVDWIACDDELYRSTRMALGLEDMDDWWDVPPVP
jgi:hypothetical protein